MRKVIALVIVVLFSVGVVGAYAADAPQATATKKGIFQNMADGVNSGAEKGKEVTVNTTEKVKSTSQSIFQQISDSMKSGADKGKEIAVGTTGYVAGTSTEASSFQRSADYINDAATAKAAAGQQSLRDNKAELKRRRCNVMQKKLFM